MSSETEFLNGALGVAGCGRIASIDDQSVNANWCKTLYPPLRRAWLGMTNWSFAGAQAQLTLEVGSPIFGYTYAYALPPTLIKVRTYNGTQVNALLTSVDWINWRFYAATWRVEGNKLYSNDAAAFIEYTTDIDDPLRWNSMFYEMAKHWLASQLAIAIRQDEGKGASLLQTAMGVFMPEALAIDGQQHAIQAYIVDDLIWGRNNG